MLRESWKAYVAHFIQADGRVIDHSAEGISTSEGQSYAMLRAVWMDDRETFDKAYHWAIDNLNSGVRKDALWAWKWGKNSAGLWRVLDPAFASDADQDAALALILAARRWKELAYQTAALLMLRDLWQAAAREAGGRLYLLAGDTLCQGRVCRINPSYYAPYAYRVFAAHDSSRPWLRLVDSSYQLLEECSRLTSTGLPPDWVNLNLATGKLTLGPELSGLTGGWRWITNSTVSPARGAISRLRSGGLSASGSATAAYPPPFRPAAKRRRSTKRLKCCRR